MQAKAKKAESRRKLEELEKDINSLESITEEQVRAEQDPVPGLLKVRQLLSYQRRVHIEDLCILGEELSCVAAWQLRMPQKRQ